MKTFITLASAAILAVTAAAQAESWTLAGDGSQVAFGSVKNGYIGEAHQFNTMDGTVSDSGDVTVNIDLSSVNTDIDIRNERMIEHVFKAAQSAKLTANIDMDKMNELGVGETAVMDIEGTLNLLDTQLDIDAPIFVARIAEDKVLVTTDKMIFIDLEELGVDEGINKLMELAGLDTITRSSPVTLRFMFQSDGSEA